MAVVGLAVLVFTKTIYWPAILPALLPLIGLMPWTGWIVVEELDLAALAVAAGGYTRLAVSAGDKGGRFGTGAPSVLRRRTRKTSRAWLYLVPLAVSTAIAALLGLRAAGDFNPSWWQGYRESLNSLRLAKPLVAIALLLPLWLAAQRTDGRMARCSLHWGFLAMLAGTALGVWWERIAYTGVLNFSSDYRTTGTFWEMHVGGAALDAILVAALPFCTVAIWRERGAVRFVALAALLTFAGYAVLVTFSRIVYLAVPVAVGCAWWLQERGSPRKAPAVASRAGIAAALWLVVNLLVVWWLFPAAGYRGLLAWLGMTVLVLRLAPRMHGLPRAAWTVGLLAGAAGQVAVYGLVTTWPQGTYAAFGAAWMATFAIAAVRRPAVTIQAFSLAGCLVALAAFVAVGVHWGGSRAWTPAVAAACLVGMLFLATCVARQPAWPEGWKWQALVTTGMATSAIVVAIFSGGAYMGGRMTASVDDGTARTVHWTRSLSWLIGPEWLYGKGLGRYLSNHELSSAADELVGDLRMIPRASASPQSDDRAAVLTSGTHVMGFGAMYRLSQRISMPEAGRARLSLQVRNATAVDVVVEICEKHLLYHNNCITGSRTLVASAGAWQKQEFELAGKTALSTGTPLAPRMAVFSIAVAQRGSRIELDNLVLLDAAQNSLLSNGSFDNGLARWFTTSDHHHMPWHAKNLFVHLLVEQGLLGLVGFLLAATAALWRVSFGNARALSISPAIAGGLVGVLIVGAVDSLLDMPRVAFVVWLMLAVALSMPARHKP